MNLKKENVLIALNSIIFIFLPCICSNVQVIRGEIIIEQQNGEEETQQNRNIASVDAQVALHESKNNRKSLSGTSEKRLLKKKKEKFSDLPSPVMSPTMVSDIPSLDPYQSDLPSGSPVGLVSDSPVSFSNIPSSDILSSPTPTMVDNLSTPKPVETTTELEKYVSIIDSQMSVPTIQTTLDDIYQKQVNNEMGSERYSILFKPGTYGSPTEPLMIKLGYYMEVAGLGANPGDVTIFGKIEVYNRCFKSDPYNDEGLFIPVEGLEGEGRVCFALNNFWRSLSNLSVNIVSLHQDTCRSRAMFWAISQASSMRRVDVIGGDLSLMDYCTDPGFASGGFIADSRASTIFSGGQQQFLTRNSDLSFWDGGVWNQMFVGVVGAPNDAVFPDPPYTTIATTPLSREKPYLYYVNGDTDESSGYFVNVPIATKDSIGITWANQVMTPGRSIPLEEFLVVTPSTKVGEINEALSVGKHVLFTPGVYEIDVPIKVIKKDTVLLGLGQATLTAMNGIIPLQLADKPGIVVAGLTLDAGEKLSKALLQVGPPDSSGSGSGDVNNPTTLSDVYFRVGGPHIGKAVVCLEINSDYVLVDHTWVWRADHGIEGFDPTDGFDGDSERWRTNIGRVGVVVNGNDVTMTGLFVEHYQEYNVIWNGNNGRVYFFQNELPYDPPSQQDWTQPDGTLGWPAYKVANNVTNHEFWSGGVYCYNRNDRSIITATAFEVPSDQPGVLFRKAYTRNLSGPGTITSIINGIGDQVDTNDKGPKYVVNYPLTG